MTLPGVPTTISALLSRRSAALSTRRRRRTGS
jgi:hypothetical protein